LGKNIFAFSYTDTDKTRGNRNSITPKYSSICSITNLGGVLYYLIHIFMLFAEDYQRIFERTTKTTDKTLSRKPGNRRKDAQEPGERTGGRSEVLERG
jgi:hypothetical protein